MLTLLRLQEGKVNVTAGNFAANQVVHCEADGDITISWAEPRKTVTTTYSMIAGDDRLIGGDVEFFKIDTGTFTICDNV